MPVLESREFGTLEYAAEDVYHFPAGLPAFDDRRAFLLLTRVEHAPIVVLQCVDDPSLRFACLAVGQIVSDYDISVVREELVEAGFDARSEDWHLLAILTLRPGHPPTANLMAPVVLCPHSHLGAQVIVVDSRFGHQYPLTTPLGTSASEAPACS